MGKNEPAMSAGEVSLNSAEHGPRRLPRRVIMFLALAGGLVVIFAIPLSSLAIHAAGSDLHSHILLIPFVTAYLIYIRRDQLPNVYQTSLGWGAVPLIFGSGALILAGRGGAFGSSLSHNDYLALMTFAFICLLGAAGFFLLGQKWMAAAAFPFAFLLFMIPLPDRVADSLETALEFGSAEVANFLFNLTGTPILRDGTVFELPGITLKVAKECSGIRSTWVLLITSLLAANLFLNGRWRRFGLVAAVIPLGLLRNGFRILFIGTLCVRIGPEMIHSVFHKRGGPPFFVISLIPLFLLLWWLRRGELIRAHAGAKQASEGEVITGV